MNEEPVDEERKKELVNLLVGALAEFWRLQGLPHRGGRVDANYRKTAEEWAEGYFGILDISKLP